MKKVDLIDRFIFFSVIGLSVFFALFRILDIPPGTQDDVLRSVITAQQYLFKLDGGFTSIRQTIAYYVLGGYWSQYFVDLARGYQNVNAMLVISRLPAALFFIFGTVIWYKTVIELGLKRVGTVIFFLIFLPSAYYLTYSHHISLVAGYFFFGSVGSYFLLRFFKSEEVKYRYLLLSTLAFGLSTYTHGISIFYAISFIIVFLILTLILRGKDFKRIILNTFSGSFKKNIIKYILVVALFLITLYPFADGLIFSDVSIKSRDANTVNYLFENNEAGLFKTKLIEKFKAYFNWNTLVFSGKIVEGTQPVDSSKFYDIKNAQYNQWVTTNLSPFGFVSVCAYIAILFIIFKAFKTKEYKYIFTLALFLSLVLIIIPTNYDNPSIAKTIVPMIFIPLSIAIFFEDITNDKSDRILRYALLFFVVINAVYNLTYLYSSIYKQNESKKYYVYVYDKVFQEILTSSYLPNTRIFLPANDHGTSDLISFYLGAHGLNRAVFGEFKKELINTNEYNYFITEDPKDFNEIIKSGLKPTVQEYKNNDINKTVYLGELLPQSKKNLKEVYSINIQNTLCGSFPYYPLRIGEQEVTQYQYRYYNTDGIFLENCPKNSNIKESVIPYDVLLDSDKLIFKTKTTINNASELINNFGNHNISINDTGINVGLNTNEVWATTNYEMISNSVKNIKLQDKSNFTLTAGESDTTFLLKVSNINPDVSTQSGTYILEYDYDIDKYGYIDFFGTETKNGISLPIAIIKQNYFPDYKGKYKTLFYLPKGIETVFTFNLINDHYNIDKNKHLININIKNLRLLHISNDDVTGLSLSLPKINSLTSLSQTNLSPIFPGIYKMENNINNENKILIQNRTYTDYIKTNEVLVNGISTGLLFGKSKPPKYLISTSLLFGIAILISNIGLMGIFLIPKTDKHIKTNN